MRRKRSYAIQNVIGILGNYSHDGFTWRALHESSLVTVVLILSNDLPLSEAIFSPSIGGRLFRIKFYSCRSRARIHGWLSNRLKSCYSVEPRKAV